MRWPWATRGEVEDVVWATIPAGGALEVELAQRTGFRLGRVHAALRRLEGKGLVAKQATPSGWHLWVALDPHDDEGWVPWE